MRRSAERCRPSAWIAIGYWRSRGLPARSGCSDKEPAEVIVRCIQKDTPLKGDNNTPAVSGASSSSAPSHHGRLSGLGSAHGHGSQLVGVQALHRAAAKQSYKLSSSHADTLLRATPHLRHLSQASVDMDGRGNFPTSRSFLSQLLPSSQTASSLSIGSIGTDLAQSSSKKGKGGFSPIADYGTCRARSRANRQAALELAAFVRVLGHEMSLEQFALVEADMFKSIFALVHSADNVNRLAGVVALDALIDVPSADEEQKAIKFANILSNGLKANCVDYEFLAAVSKALGRMATGAANVDYMYVEAEITRALEWLGTERSDRRLAATLTLKEIAQNAPTAFFTKTTQTMAGQAGSNDFLDRIFPVLRDPQPIVRVCAADALGACLRVIIERKPRSTTGLLCQVYTGMMDGFDAPKRSKRSSNNNNTNVIGNLRSEAGQHASLLVLREMLDHCRNFILPRLENCCDEVLELSGHQKALIRLETIRLIPRLAQCAPGGFSRRYLRRSLDFLMESAIKPPPQKVGVDLRPAAFFAIGQLALAMRDPEGDGIIRTTIQIRRKRDDPSEKEYIYNSEDGDIYSRLGDIFALVKSELHKSRLSAATKPAGGISADTRCEALHCGADLVQALGEHSREFVPDLLECMFETGMSRDLILCLRAIASRLPAEKLAIEDRLLEEISVCLAGTTTIRAICDPFRQSRAMDSRNAGVDFTAEGVSGSRPRSMSNWSSRSRRMSSVALLPSDSHLSSAQLDTSAHWATPAVAAKQSSDPRIDIEGEAEDQGDISIFIDMANSRSAVEKLVLSLRTLGSFGKGRNEQTTYGSCVTLLPFVRDVVVQYLSHPSSDVRREASLTCCLLLLPKGDAHPPDDALDRRLSYGESLAGLQPKVSSNGLILQMRLGGASCALVEEVLKKLLASAVSDLSPLVRNCIVRALDARYDPYLCQAHHLPALFLLLQDESLAVRAAALRLLGRLAVLNPAPILPKLRRVLVELILELRCGGDTGGGRESTTRLLVVFLQGEALRRLIHPFLPSIIEAFPLKGVPPRSASASLEALGELAQVTRKSMTPWIQQLIPHIIETMQDQSSSNKQRTSMKTLGQIASATGYVIRPYIDYPQLLPIAADILPATKRAPWALRREVIRTLGILGALDPDHYFAHKARKRGGAGGGYFIEGEDDAADPATALDVSAHSSSYDGTLRDSNLSDARTSTVVAGDHNLLYAVSGSQVKPRIEVGAEIKGKDADGEEPAHLYMYEQYAMTSQPDSELPPARRLTPSDEDFYPTVAVQALTRILKDPSLAVYHGMVMQAVMYIFNNLGQRCVPFLKRIVPHILHTIRTCGQDSLRESLLQQVASLSGIVRDHLRPYLPAIFDVVEEFWNNNRHLGTILSLVEKMADGVPGDFENYVPRLVPQILASIEASQIKITEWRAGIQHFSSAAAQFDRLELILRSIRRLRGTLGDYLQLLVPALVKLADALTDPAPTVGTTNYPGFTRLTIAMIQTISVLLITADASSLPLTSVSSAGRLPRAMVAVSPSSSSLPARAAQPLMRMLSRNVGRDVGFALIEAICVCAKRLGKVRWMSFFHLTAIDVITRWQDRAGLGPVVEDPTQSIGDGDQYQVGVRQNQGGRQELTGLLLYNEVIREMTTGHLLSSDSTFAAGAGRELVNESQQYFLSENAEFEGPDLLGDSDIPASTPLLLPPITSSGQPSTNKLRVNQANLQQSWDVSSRSTREDWDEWMQRFAVQLLKEAPSPALRATAGLAQAYQPLGRELFAAAFVCCWEDLNDQYQQHLVRSLEAAFVADVSPEILQTLLNLAEFMEQCEGVGADLPIDISILADLALKCRNYAKALHYKEREHNTRSDGGACIEDLISINRKLDLPEAALGAVKAAQVELERQGEQLNINPQYGNSGSVHHHLPSRLFHHEAQDMAYSVMASAEEIAALGGGSWAGVQMQESWLAKLGSWSEALQMYEGKLDENPQDVGAILGCMRCLDARAEWSKVIDLAKRNWHALNESGENGSKKHLRKATKLCAEAAWRLGQWDELDTYASQLSSGVYDPSSYKGVGPDADNSPRDSSLPRIDFDGSFYSAVSNIHKKEWSLAADAIDDARRAMDSRFTALMAESYKRAYPSMVTAQALSELEEIVTFRKLEDRAIASKHQHPANRADAEEARAELLSVWRSRLAGCREDADVHASILAVRSLVLGPTDEVAATLSLSALSRQAQSFKLAERLLVDPLRQLGADMDGPAFGFALPSSLGLGLQPPGDGSNGYVSDSGMLDRLVTGRAEDFLPSYEAAHQRYTRSLVEEAGGLDRLNIQHRLYYAYTKHLWATDHHDEALMRVSNLCNVVDMVAHCDRGAQDRGLRVACWLKLGEWTMAESIQPGSAPMSESLQIDVLTAYKRATASSSCGYKAWHAWALINFRLAQQINDSPGFRLDASYGSDSLRLKSLRNHVIAAVKGFVSAICLGTKRWSASVQQDLLNFLTCLFNFGELPEVAATINALINSVKIEAWLGVLPQLLARIHIKSPSVRSVLHPLLIRLGADHPQALMYPLSVLLKSPVVERKVAAESLMTSLKAHSYSLVEEALMVSSELIRVAILWLELWYDGFEDASRLYFGEGNVKGMLDVLIPLHEQLEQGPTTHKERDFYRNFGRDLAEAHLFLKEYIRLTTSNGGVIPSTGGFNAGSDQNEPPSSPGLAVQQNAEAEAALNQAWDLYYGVFRRINKQLPGLTSLELSQCSPALEHARNLELGVPGSYRVDGSYVRIEKFIPKVQVITSKQRPRKITIRGNDGKDYVFLLKGHEDLRQDERVMQLFGLVNALLARDRRTNQYDLNIKRYAIAPLSHNAGVVGWVPHTDTLHSLIRDYRDSKRIPLNMENREMMKLAPNYDLLTVMQKVEVFTEALDRTTGKGNDLYEVLWMKSTNSEEWLERRTKFTRSLAVMSMVGYILGLGDRHPSNLMLDQVSGRVLHIDFGDCFEVAMHREKFPEKVPFRLTRMLIEAMEVCGVEGSYRSTCERTMGVLRDNRDSLVAMLEAFVYDPLISWRLLGDASDGEDVGQQQEQQEQQQQQQQEAPPGAISVARTPERASGVAAVPVAPSGSVLHGTIREGEEDEEESVGDSGGINGHQETAVGEERDGNLLDQDDRGEVDTNAENAGRTAHARSLQMYNNMQSMAAAYSASARVASIVGGDTNRAAVTEGSLARSRIDRSVRQREAMSLFTGDEDTLVATEEALNEKALKVIRRVQDKLAGTDFLGPDEIGDPLDVQDQVQKLIVQATSSENLCQLFIGWCAFW